VIHSRPTKVTCLKVQPLPSQSLEAVKNPTRNLYRRYPEEFHHLKSRYRKIWTFKQSFDNGLKKLLMQRQLTM
jgi:hypothetical protein